MRDSIHKRKEEEGECVKEQRGTRHDGRRTTASVTTSGSDLTTTASLPGTSTQQSSIVVSFFL